jgi:dephospho-CoA kinase
MKVVVLTGGIASGKSAVGAVLADLGVPLIDADRIAREIVAPGRDAHREIVDAFGREILTEGGEIDREGLGRIVFGDPERRTQLEKITHPRIGARMAEIAGRHAAEGAPALILDIPLFIENRKRGRGAPITPDAVIVVTLTPEIQLQRLMDRDGLSQEEALARIGAQLPLAEKEAEADYVIDNSGTPEETARQVREMWRRLLEAIGKGTPPGPGGGNGRRDR